MAKPTLNYNDIALHLARYFDGQEDALRYLSDVGIKWQPATVELPNSARHSSETEAEHLTSVGSEPVPVRDALPDFDFPIYLVKRIKPNDNKEKNTVPEVPSYHPGMETNNQAHPPKPLLEHWSALLTRLETGLKSQQLGHSIDVRNLVKQAAQLNIIEQLPLIKRQYKPDQLWIYIDTSRAGFGMTSDAFNLVAQLRQHWPDCAVKVLVFPQGGMGDWGFQGGILNSSLPPLPDSTAKVLIITGLQVQSVLSWGMLQNRLQKRGVTPLFLSTLLPEEALLAEFYCDYVIWGSQSNPKGWKLTQLNAVLYSTRFITGAMLRSLIQFLQLPAGFETLFWQQSIVSYGAGSDSGFFVSLSAGTAQKLENTLQEIDIELLWAISSHMQPYLKGLSNSVFHEHIITLNLLRPEFKPNVLPTSIAFFASMGQSLKTNDTKTHGIAVFLADSLQRMGEHLRDADPGLKGTFALVCHYLVKNQLRHSVPHDILQQTQTLLAEEESGSVTLSLVQSQDRLYLEKLAKDSQEKQITDTTAAQIAKISTKENSPVAFISKENITSQSARMITDRECPFELPAKIPESFDLQSHSEVVSITRRKASDFWWATKVSVTKDGVVAETEHIKVIWPNQPEQDFEFAKWGVRTGGPNRGSTGGMMCFTQSCPTWFHSHRPELDETGLVNRLQVHGVEFNMRYIPPGSFLMGSPKDEPERFDDETLHPVTLTQGFWIGETTVTQKLWQAVMGENPSHFQAQEDQELPVEQVSWHDCQKFCKKLSELTGAKFSLPTEAQWEYACRAGTTTPFNTGEQLGYEQSNYDVNHPYEGREKLVLQSGQEYRNKTVDVHRFEANKWGLKQMHGNVLEWCKDDWQEKPGAQHRTDPVQSGNPDAVAVLRGGSWRDFGRFCRSAYRLHFGRGIYSFDIGLRVTQVIEEAEPVGKHPKKGV